MPAALPRCKVSIKALVRSNVNTLFVYYQPSMSQYEDGRLGDPVSEMTIAANLKDMFRTLVPADDLVFRYGTNAPTVLIPEMTIAGR